MPKRQRKAAAVDLDDDDQPSDEQPHVRGAADADSDTQSDSAVTDGSEEADSVDDDDGSSKDDEVEVDIEFFDPKAADFHGIKTLLTDLLGGTPFDAAQLADAVIAQSSVGTVVKSGEDEDPIGVASVLNLHRYRDLECLQQIAAYLTEHCSSSKLKLQLNAALRDAGSGLLLNQRLVNAPPQVAPPLMQALFDEISWAVEDEPTKANTLKTLRLRELQDSFRFTQFLVIAPAYRDPQAPSEEATQRPAKQPKKRPKLEPLVYTKPEDEYFHKHCSWSFTIATPKEGQSAEDLAPLRLIMLVTIEQAAAARSAIDQVVGNVAADSDGPQQE